MPTGHIVPDRYLEPQPQGSYFSTSLFSYVSNGSGGFAAWSRGSSAKFLLGQTYHIVWTVDAVSATLYVNGQFEVSHASTTSPGGGSLLQNWYRSNQSQIGLGWDAAPSFGSSWRTFPGAMGDVALYKTALSQERILAHWNARADDTTYNAEVLADNPTGFWKMSEASGNFIDSSTNGIDLAWGGATKGTRQTEVVRPGQSLYTNITGSGYIGYLSPASNALTELAWAEVPPLTTEAWIKPIAWDMSTYYASRCYLSCVADASQGEGWFLSINQQSF